MSIRFEGRINVEKIVDRFLNFIFGTISSRLMMVGIGFLTFGKLDVIVFAIEAIVLNRDVKAPGSDFGVFEYIGSSLFALGLIISFISSLISRSDKNSDRKLRFLEGYAGMSHSKLQEEAWKVFKIRSPDIDGLIKVLSHPRNQRGAITLFRHCHLNVEPDGNWFSLKGRYYKIRHKVSFLIWAIAFTLLFIFTFLSLAGEFKSSSTYSLDIETLLAYALVVVSLSLGALMTLGEIKKIGTAVTLVEEYVPPPTECSQRSRDVIALDWILSTLHVPTIENHIHESPRVIRHRVFHFWESFKGTYDNGLFHLYDTELQNLVEELYTSWSITLSYDYCYRDTNNEAYIFSNPGDAPLTDEQERCWQEIDAARIRMHSSLSSLLELIRDKYIEIDIMDTNRKAWNDFIEYQ